MVFSSVLNFIFPQSCFVCGAKSPGVCRGCLKCFEPARHKCLRCGRRNPLGVYCDSCHKPSYPELILARYCFKGAIRELIHQFKYEDCTTLATPLALVLAQIIKNQLASKDYLITYVPISKAKQVKRGYNQAKLLAEVVSRESKLPIAGLVMRVDTPQSQVQVDDPVQRRQNIKGVFKVKKDVRIPKKIILIDDVVTTGSTVVEVTRVLKRAGAKEVVVLALAMA